MRGRNQACADSRITIHGPLIPSRATIIEVIVAPGPHSELDWHQYRLEYRGEERTLFPYPGLSEFKRIRINRDYYFGRGMNADDPDAKIKDDDE